MSRFDRCQIYLRLVEDPADLIWLREEMGLLRRIGRVGHSGIRRIGQQVDAEVRYSVCDTNTLWLSARGCAAQAVIQGAP